MRYPLASLVIAFLRPVRRLALDSALALMIRFSTIIRIGHRLLVRRALLHAFIRPVLRIADPRMNAYASAFSVSVWGRVVDRIDAMKVFVTALGEGSLAGAGRKLGKSPAAVSRAIAFLEAHVGTELLHRTTRSIKLSEAGERYAVACRRILTDLEEADMIAAGERSAPRGLLTITAPVAAGEGILRPMVDDFMDQYPAVNV